MAVCKICRCIERPTPSGKSLGVHHQGLPSHLVEQVQGLDLVMEYKVSMCAGVCVLMYVSVKPLRVKRTDRYKWEVLASAQSYRYRR